MRFSWENCFILCSLLCLVVLANSCKTRQPEYTRHDYQQEQIGEIKQLIKSHNHRGGYPVYEGNISCDSLGYIQFVQFDSVRVFCFEGNPSLTPLFCQGKLRPSMVYCQLDSDCQLPPQAMYTTVGDTTKKPFDLFGWTGHTVQVLNVFELKGLKTKPQQRILEVWVYPEIFRPNSGSYVFILNLENRDANRKTSLESFMSGAEVMMFKYYTGIL